MAQSNYPPGADRDPRAPWLQEPDPVCEVLVVETLTRKADVQPIIPTPPDDLTPDDLRHAYRAQHPTLEEALGRCQRVLRKLIAHRTTFVDDISLPALLCDIKGWATEDVDVDWF